jgi:hypothetical protein
MKERFIEFLEKNKCLDQFKENINNKEDFDVYCNRTWENNTNWVTSAFTWMGSKQGGRFWMPLHEEWSNLAYKYQKELDSNN